MDFSSEEFPRNCFIHSPLHPCFQYQAQQITSNWNSGSLSNQTSRPLVPEYIYIYTQQSVPWLLRGKGGLKYSCKSFTELYFTYHTIHPFEVYILKIINITDWWNHHHGSFLEHFYSSNKIVLIYLWLIPVLSFKGNHSFISLKIGSRQYILACAWLLSFGIIF